MWLEQKQVVTRLDLEAWEQKYKGRTAEEVAKRVIVRYRPSEEELMRLVGRRQAGDRGGGAAEEGEDGSGGKGGEEGDDRMGEDEARAGDGRADFGEHVSRLRVSLDAHAVGDYWGGCEQVRLEGLQRPWLRQAWWHRSKQARRRQREPALIERRARSRRLLNRARWPAMRRHRLEAAMEATGRTRPGRRRRELGQVM